MPGSRSASVDVGPSLLRRRPWAPSKARHKPDQIATIVQPLIVDWPIAGGIRRALQVSAGSPIFLIQRGAQFGPPGFETDLLYLACLAAIVLGHASGDWGEVN